MRFALIFPSVINEGENVACSNSILSIYCSMWSKVNLSWQQLFWIAHKLNFIQASTESNNVAEIIDSLSYRGKSTTIVPIWKSIGFIGVLILYLETGVCCMFPSYISAWSSIAYLLFNVLSRIYFSSTLLSWLYFCSNYF